MHAKGGIHREVKTCATEVFDAEVDGKRTRMLAAVAPRQVLPYPAIVGQNGSGLHVHQEMDPQGSNREQPLPLSNETKTFKCYHGLDGDLSQPRSYIGDECRRNQQP